MKPSSARRLSTLIASTVARALPLATAHLVLPFQPDELHRVPTDDGAAIALGRYHPRGERRFVEPVILCHGLGANRFNLDLDARHSVARFLAGRGYEAWVMELRGRSLSGPVADTTIDAQAEFDVRAALRTVTAASGAPAVTWVGHSKGGIVLYAHLARNPEAPVRAAVTLGSPVVFGVQPGLQRFMDAIGPLLRMKSIPASRLATLAPLGAIPSPITRALLLEKNVEPEVIKRALHNIASDIPGGVARQFDRWIRTGKFDSMDGKIDYRQRLEALRLPLLMIAGSRDLLAPPLAVARAKEWVRGPVKVTIAGKAHGFAEDYGHSDLVIGRRAPHEVFPLIDTFLAANSTRV